MNGISPVRIVKLAAWIQIILSLWIFVMFVFNGILQDFITWKLTIGGRAIMLGYMSSVLLALGSIGVLRGKTWGWWTSVTIYIYLFYLSVQNLITLDNDIRSGVSLLVSLSLLVLLFTAAVRKAYQIYRKKSAVLILASVGLGGMYRIVVWVISNSMVQS